MERKKAPGRKPRGRSIPPRIANQFTPKGRAVLKKTVQILTPLTREERAEVLRMVAEKIEAAKDRK